MWVLQVSPYKYDDNNSLKAQLHICIDWADWHCTTLLIYVSVIPSTEQCKSTGWKVRNIGQQVVFCLNHICKDLPCYWKDLSVTWLCAVNGIKNPIASRRLSSPPWQNRQMWTKPPASADWDKPLPAYRKTAPPTTYQQQLGLHCKEGPGTGKSLESLGPTGYPLHKAITFPNQEA